MGESKRRKQLDPNYGKPKPKITVDSSDINVDLVKALGAVQPSDDMLPPAITWGIQIQGIHDYQQLFTNSLHFINRGLNPARICIYYRAI